LLAKLLASGLVLQACVMVSRRRSIVGAGQGKFTMAGKKAQIDENKLKARQARNEAQAIEERSIWGKLEEGANQAREIQKRKPKIYYSEELALEICEELSNGISLHKICQRDDMPPPSSIYRWLAEEAFFRDCYARARENAAHTLFDQMIDIADNSSRDLLEDGSANNAAIARARLQIETRARVAGKLHVRVYGERIETLPQTVTNNLTILDANSLGADQRNALRTMLVQARDHKIIDN